MNTVETNVAASLLAMPQSDVPQFIKQSMKERKLCSIVSLLNSEALSKRSPDAEMAALALKKMGFVD